MERGGGGEPRHSSAMNPEKCELVVELMWSSGPAKPADARRGCNGMRNGMLTAVSFGLDSRCSQRRAQPSSRLNPACIYLLVEPHTLGCSSGCSESHFSLIHSSRRETWTHDENLMSMYIQGINRRLFVGRTFFLSIHPNPFLLFYLPAYSIRAKSSPVQSTPLHHFLGREKFLSCRDPLLPGSGTSTEKRTSCLWMGNIGPESSLCSGSIMPW